MSALKIQNTLSEIEQNMAEIAPYRRAALFNEFLVHGYTAITLSSVSEEKFSELLRAKLCLGTLITLYDDFADRPTHVDPELLEVLYQSNFEKFDHARDLHCRNRQVLDFARSLFSQIRDILLRQPHFHFFSEFLNFDLTQFYSANKYSSLMTANRYLNNPLENRLYCHHNMGMVMVSMMDLMATLKIEFSEFGAMREVFVMGQRMGRIFNVLTTRKREVIDGDITGELANCRSERAIQSAEKKLNGEICELQIRIESFDSRITTFSVKAYLEGLVQVQRLHEKMEGTI